VLALLALTIVVVCFALTLLCFAFGVAFLVVVTDWTEIKTREEKLKE
jgi:hypothetical protein